jgi:RecB family exonuclease
VITPRQTRLVRVPDLAAFRAVLCEAVAGLDPLSADETFLIVPTRAAGEQLRRTIEDRLLAPERPPIAWPRVGTRADWYRELAARASPPPDMLSPFDREVLFGRAAREAAEGGMVPPFGLRPALVAEMVALYDQVRRQARTTADFDRNLRAELEAASEADRGAAALLAQTAFLSAVFRGYEVQLTASGARDEHLLRETLTGSPSERPLARVIVAVADRVADPDGLWPVDLTLLSTLPDLQRIDVVATEGLLASGWIERLHSALPGIEDSVPGVAGVPGVPGVPRGHHAAQEGQAPVLEVPALDGPPVFVSRDREEELCEVARRVKADRRACDGTPLHRRALVVRRPLPYLYLARTVFGGAGIPFEAVDTLPLAAEPYAAALDLVLEFVISGFARQASVALLRSPHFDFGAAGPAPSASAVEALDRALADARYLGGLDRLFALVESWRALDDVAGSREERRRREAVPAAALVHGLATELAPLADQRAVPAQVALLGAFLDRYDRAPAPAADPERQRRVRQAIRGALDAIARAHVRHDAGRTASVEELSFLIRRWLGAQTFAIRTGARGLQILDTQAAAFADLDDVQLMGLVEGEWPERPRRSVFYPPFLLALVEPSRAAGDPTRRENDTMRAARAAFHDLLRLARTRVRVSTFSLESDAIVEPSPFVDDLAASGLSRSVGRAATGVRVFTDEALALEPPVLDRLPEAAAAWARLRLARREGGEGRHRGEAGAWRLPRVSVGRVDRYLGCPFQFFSTEVLRLEEEPEDEDAPPPWERGRFLHALFEAFFSEWQARGRGPIAADCLAEARRLFVEVGERALATLSDVDASLERLRLFGSAAGAGIVDRVLSIEADRADPIERRLIEYRLDDVFTFRRSSGETGSVPLRAKVDRVDLLADGTFRVIDYKSRVVPDFKHSVQLQIYTSAVAQQLRQGAERARAPREAFYLSFEGDTPVKALRAGRDRSLDDVIAAAEDCLLQALDDIREGHFPPRPNPRSRCNTCPFETVCRRAYVEAADE